jgi:hypothetical protein
MRACLPGHGCLLCLQVAEEAAGGQPGDETMRVADQFRSGLVAEDDLLVRDEQPA